MTEKKQPTIEDRLRYLEHIVSRLQASTFALNMSFMDFLRQFFGQEPLPIEDRKEFAAAIGVDLEEWAEQLHKDGIMTDEARDKFRTKKTEEAFELKGAKTDGNQEESIPSSIKRRGLDLGLQSG